MPHKSWSDAVTLWGAVVSDSLVFLLCLATCISKTCRNLGLSSSATYWFQSFLPGPSSRELPMKEGCKALNLALFSLCSSHNWNTLFVGTSAVADAIAQKYNASKSQVLDHVSWLLIGRDGRSFSHLFSQGQDLPDGLVQQKLLYNREHCTG